MLVQPDASVVDVYWEYSPSLVSQTIVCGFQVQLKMKGTDDWVILDSKQSVLNPDIQMDVSFQTEANGTHKAMVSKSARKVRIMMVPPGEYEARIIVCKEPKDVTNSGKVTLGELARHSINSCNVTSTFSITEKLVHEWKAHEASSATSRGFMGYNYWDFYVNITDIFSEIYDSCNVDSGNDIDEDEYTFLFKNVLGASPAVLRAVEEAADGSRKLEKEKFCSCLALHLSENLKLHYAMEVSRLSEFWDTVSDNRWFIMIANLAIVTAALSDTLASYPGSTEEQQDTLYGISVACLAIFTIECLVKMARVKFHFGMYFIGTPGTPQQYLHLLYGYIVPTEWIEVDEESDSDKEEAKLQQTTNLLQAPNFTSDGCWNTFDFVIVLIGWFDIANLTSGVSFMRTLRLLRTLKLFGRSQQLLAMLQGLSDGLRDSRPILLLWVVLWLLFSFIGVAAFGKNNPFSFGSLDASFLSLYIISTMDWGDIYNVDQYGCNRHDGNEVYTQCNLTTQTCPGLDDKVNKWLTEENTTRTIADFGQQSAGSTPSSDPNQVDLRHYCYAPLGYQHNGQATDVELAVPSIYYLFFVLIVGLILMTLFMGSVSMSMVNVMDSLQKAERRRAKKLKLLKMRHSYHLLSQDSRKWPNELNFHFSVRAKVAFSCETISTKRFLERSYQVRD